MESTLLTLRVTPKSSRDAIVGWHGDALKIKVRAAPEKGRANDAAIKLLARELGLAQNLLSIESGHTSSHKRIRITGLTDKDLRARFGAAKSQTP